MNKKKLTLDSGTFNIHRLVLDEITELIELVLKMQEKGTDFEKMSLDVGTISELLKERRSELDRLAEICIDFEEGSSLGTAYPEDILELYNEVMEINNYFLGVMPQMASPQKEVENKSSSKPTKT